MLIEIDGRRFTGGADSDDCGRAVGDVKIDELAISGEIERAAGLHRRGDRHQATSQHEKRGRKKRILPEYCGWKHFAAPNQGESLGGHVRPGPTAAIRSITAGLSRFDDSPCSNATMVKRPRTSSTSSPSRSRKSGFRGGP